MTALLGVYVIFTLIAPKITIYLVFNFVWQENLQTVVNSCNIQFFLKFTIERLCQKATGNRQQAKSQKQQVIWRLIVIENKFAKYLTILAN